MLGVTSDISQFNKLELFERIMFEIAPFPDVVLKLGHYLGSSIDVGAAMTTKILTQNGQVLQKSMYRSLSPHEITDKDGLYAQDQFVVRVYEKLGFGGHRAREYPQYDPQEDETQNEQIFPQFAEKLEPMLEMADH